MGCILGPLLACFTLLPLLGERGSIVALAVPLFGIALFTATRWWTPLAAIAVRARPRRGHPRLHRLVRDVSGAARLRGDGDRHRNSRPKTAARQRRRHHGAHADHQVHGASAAGVLESSAGAGARDLLRHGHQLSIGALLGCLDDGGRARAWRAGAFGFYHAERAGAAAIAAARTSSSTMGGDFSSARATPSM